MTADYDMDKGFDVFATIMLALSSICGVIMIVGLIDSLLSHTWATITILGGYALLSIILARLDEGNYEIFSVQSTISALVVVAVGLCCLGRFLYVGAQALRDSQGWIMAGIVSSCILGAIYIPRMWRWVCQFCNDLLVGLAGR